MRTYKINTNTELKVNKKSHAVLFLATGQNCLEQNRQRVLIFVFFLVLILNSLTQNYFVVLQPKTSKKRNITS